MNNEQLNECADSIFSMVEEQILDTIEFYIESKEVELEENKIFEARLSVPGDEFIVKKQCKSFEEGADSAVQSLERQLKRRKEKLRAHS